MNDEIKRDGRRRRSAVFLLLLLLPALPYLAGCDGNGGTNRVVAADVSAVSGGTFSDNPFQPSFTLSIPPGALNTDATLTVDVVANPPEAGPNQTAASRAFLVTLAGTGVSLSEPMQLEIAAAPAPVHPQIGEIAALSGNVWERLNANFFRPSDQKVVALTTQTQGTFQVVHRTLQSTAGPAAAAGFDVFLNETFGNENFFGDVVGLHTLLNGVAPSAAVALGVQVDLAKVPAGIVAVMTGTDLSAKNTALAEPAVTRQLIKAGAVIGVKGFYNTPDPADDQMIRTGITCALCHLNVTPTEFELTGGPTLLPIGPLAVDGVPTTGMDAGAILALTPFAQPAGIPTPTSDLLNSWGPTAFDVRALPDNPLDDGVNNPTSNPPIWNFVDLEEQGYAFGWDGLFLNDGINNNALAGQAEAVYDLVMHANGAFGTAQGNLPPELSITPPAELLLALADAETAQPGNNIDTQALLDLQTWMRSITSPAPAPFPDLLREELAEKGFRLFHGSAQCRLCHQTAEFTGPGLFTDITAVPPAGDLAGGIRVPGLRGVSRTAPYFHDHSALTLEDVVARFVARGTPVPLLSPAEQAALVEYLKSL